MSISTNSQNNTHSPKTSEREVCAGVNRFELGDKLSQSFTASKSHLSCISIQLSTISGSAHGKIRIKVVHLGRHRRWLRFLPTSAKLVFDRHIPLSPLFDEEFYEARFNPIPDSSGNTFRIELIWIPGSGNDSAGFMLRENNRSSAIQNAVLNSSETKGFSLSFNANYAPPIVDNPCPPGLMISPVTRCDLNCVYCISRETRKSLHAISPKILEQIKKFAANGDLDNAMNDYSGDIFFSERKHGGYLKFMKELDIPLSISTHANLLSDEAIDFLLSSRLVSLNFSLDASNPETYQRIRKGSKPLESVKNNIRLFMRKRLERGRTELVCSISIVLMKSNMEETLGLMDFAAEVGITHIYGSHLQVYTSDLEEESMFNHKDLFNELWYLIQNRARELNLFIAMPRRFEDKPVRSGHRHCQLPWNSAILCGNGDLMACCVPTTVMGNVNQQSIEQIWNGPEYQELRRRVNSENPPEVCQHCPIYRIESNPTSFFFNRIKPSLKPLRIELQESLRQNGQLGHH